MSAIADDPGAELRALRVRAYGPDADIHDDPVAMQRLRELEDGERARPAPAVAPDIDAMRGRFDDEAGAPRRVDRTAVPGEAGRADLAEMSETPRSPTLSAERDDTSPRPEAPAHAGAAGSDAGAAQAGGDPAAAVPAETPPWWRRRMPLLWAGSLVAAALLGGAAAVSIQTVWSGQVAVLSENTDNVWPEGFFSPRPEGGAMFEEFHGLTVVRVPQEMGPDGMISDCVYVLLGPSNGMMGAGCSAGTFPATAAIVVSGQAPAELRERFEPGTALQFVLDGSEVRVYAAAPAPGVTP